MQRDRRNFDKKNNMRIGKDKEELFPTLISILELNQDQHFNEAVVVKDSGRVFNVFFNLSIHFTQALPKIEGKIYRLPKLKM